MSRAVWRSLGVDTGIFVEGGRTFSSLIQTSRSCCVDCFRRAIRGARSGILTPGKIVVARAGEMDAADGCHHVRPHFGELAKGERVALAAVARRLFLPPLVHDHLLN